MPSREVRPNSNGYHPGAVIMRSRPWVYSIKPCLLERLCYRCLKPLPVLRDVHSPKTDNLKNGNLMGKYVVIEPHLPKEAESHAGESPRRHGWTCCRCGIPVYCSMTCQEEDWEEGRHQVECSHLARFASRQEAMKSQCDLFLMLAIIKKLQVDQVEDAPGACQDLPPSLEPRTFRSLLTHHELFGENRLDFLRDMKAGLEMLLPPDELPDDVKLREIFGALQVNCFGIRDSAFVGIGEGLYLQPSMIDHSCTRNAVFLFDGPLITIKAIKPVATLEEVRISYTETFAATETRQSRFTSGYYFSCQCDLCSNPDKDKNASLFRLKCPSSCCSYGKWCGGPCPKCGYTLCQSDEKAQLNLGATYTRRYLSGIDEVDERIDLLGRRCPQWTAEDVLKDCLIIINKCEPVLAEGNALLGMAYDRAGRLFLNIAKHDMEAAFNHFRRSLPALRTYLDQMDPRLAMQLLLAGLLAFTLHQMQEAQLLLRDALNIFTASDARNRKLAQVCRLLLGRCCSSSDQKLLCSGDSNAFFCVDPRSTDQIPPAPGDIACLVANLITIFTNFRHIYEPWLFVHDWNDLLASGDAERQ